MGDIHAEPGTHTWAVAVRDHLNRAIKDTSSSAKFIKSMVDLLKQYQGYQTLTDKDGNAFTSFEAFCLAPSPHGLGHKPEELNAIIITRWAAQYHASTATAIAPHGGPRNKDNGDQVDSYQLAFETQGGTSATYLTRRIARDRPDILERMEQGEFSSVRQAAIKAGIIKPEKRLSIPIDPERAARSIKRHFTSKQVRELIEFLN